MRKLKLLLVLCMVAIAASASKTVYLAPGVWDVSDATEYYAIWAWEDGGSGKWYVMTGPDADGIYQYTFDNDAINNLQFGRMGSATLTSESDYNTAEKWNTTGDINGLVNGSLFTISGEIATPTVTQSIYGATAASFTDKGKYLFKNIGSGKYLGPGTNYGTRASLLDQSHFNTLNKISDGVFKIETQVSNGGTNYYLGLNGSSEMFMDNGGKNISITNIGNNKYVLSFEGESTYIGYDGTNKYTVHNLTDFSSDNAQWTIVSYDEALSGASDTNPVDATFMVLCQNFDRNHRSANAWTMEASNKNLCGGQEMNKCAESWRSSFTLSQTITVPNGYYKIRAQAACWEYDVTGADYPVVYADEVSTPFKKMTDDSGGMDKFSERFANGEYFTDWSDMLTVTDKQIVVGVKGTRTNTWCIWDNIQLMYYGPIDLSGYVTALADAVAAAEALDGTIPTACYDAIDAVVDEKNKTYDNEDDYIAAIAAINTAINTYAYDNIKLAYARYQRIKTAVLAIKSDIDVSTADAAANAAMSNTDIDAAVPTLRNALTTYLAGVEDKDINLTDALIDNPEPGISGKLDYWTTNQSTGYGNNLYEFYNKTDASSRQTIPATMPVGYYKMTVVGYTREGQNAKMFVDKGSDNVANQVLVGVASSTVNSLGEGNTWIAGGNGTNEMVFNLTDAAVDNLTIGIWGGDTGDKWTAWRSFKLEFLGTTPLFVFDELLTAAIANGRTTVEGLAVPAGVKSTFNTYADDIATAKSSYTTPAEFNTAIDNINAAVVAAKDAVAPTAENANVKAKATAATTQLTDLADADKATLQGVIDGNDAALAACATAVEVEAQNNALWAAIGTAINSITVTTQLDLTFLLTNPDLTSLPAWQNCDGWYSEQTDGNRQVMHTDREDVKADDGKNCFYEYWSYNAKANDKFNLYTKLNLPEGTYTISCYAFATQQDGEAGKTPVEGVYFYANDTQGDVVANTKLAQKFISFVNDAQQEVKIGLKALSSGNTFNWMGIGYVELYKVPAQSYTVDETQAWDNTVAGAGAVTLNRTIKAGVNTLVLPFSMTQAEVETNFGAGSKVYAMNSFANENISFTTHDGISANTPCLLKATEAGTSYAIEGRTIVAGEPKASVTGLDFIGTYAASITVPTGSYIISGGKIYNVNSAVTLKNTRAYFATTSGARVMTFTLDGEETTGIVTMENGELNIETGAIYDLSGRRVVAPTKGLYIINGKKVVK